MRKRELKQIFASFLIASTLLAACNTKDQSSEKQEEKKQEETVKEEAAEKEEVNATQVYQEAIAELDKAKEGKEVDFTKVSDLYTKNLQGLVQDRDAEVEATHDQHITAALQAGKEGTMDPIVSRQIFDKLMQKVFYTTIKHEFTEIDEKWGNAEEVNKELEEAKEYYAILKTTVEKRDAAYGTNMVDAIAGGFEEIETAVKGDDKLGFLLGKQVVDKTLMKTFYLATGALPNGYATKASAEAKTDQKVAKIEQAEGWAFYQSLFPYLNKHAQEEAAYINQQFDLQTDVAALDPALVNKAFIRGFAQTALDEYKESQELWGQEKSPVTALEGALFIDIIGEDVKGLLGEQAYTDLTKKAQDYLEAAKSKDKQSGDPLIKDLNSALQTVIEKAK
ncbi:hypothetical protein [Bacillus sp. 03113]|uniref:hypothetical protein n=1 Tax=Bacillus sp. 03113 TaxID=2578211 RepID=UPI001143FE6D|nr:hypothetical protein [Bacillus sp. 03113]